MKTADTTNAVRNALSPADAWEHSWEKHWRKQGLPGYELPANGPGSHERDFLATLIQCKKIGPFPLLLMVSDFWAGLQRWGKVMMDLGVFARDEIGFGRVTDSPAEAVDLIRRGLPPALNRRLQAAKLGI